ncbi:MAG: Recombinase [Parcubacteria group bacterium GW2011_GWB1_41_5]|nr:MAG: Recombinase [Parcubacteria group bacterium GW2011_GWA2_40_37]KKS10241.1 MAG: Recombinase [Parcubacteria group bacterium GW2011_GWB1_41_5]
MNYFLYARKSTDVEDKQILSIESQLAELRELAKRENLHIADEFIEKRSAKIPGRPVFNEMLKRIQAGEVQGIVCWKIDRLSRNPVDSGKIQWLLQQGIIQHIQTHSQSHYSNDNVLMMSVELGMANEYVRQLSENTARGLRQKARNGDFPSLAPFGYINNPAVKKIAIHKKNAKLVKKMFELYATGNVRLENLAVILEKANIFSKNKNRIHVSRVSHIINNPIYYGHFRHAGEIYEGKHQPIISKALFDKANSVLRGRGRTPDKKTDPRPFCGLLSCGNCGMGITGEIKIKRQKNGTTHLYTYYHCSKKSKTQKCSEPCIRAEELDRQLSNILSEYILPKEWATKLFAMLDTEEQKTKQTASEAVQELRGEEKDISHNLARLTDVYVAQDIERSDYLERRRLLMSKKKSIEEQIARFERTPSAWIEPTREWIKDALILDEISKTADLPSKKLSLQKIFGSNLFLKSRIPSGNPLPHYAELRSARKNFTKKSFSLIAEPLVGIGPTVSFLPRTCFTTKLQRHKDNSNLF